MRTEQRISVRFLAQDNIIVALRNDFTKIGRVKDISEGGLSFEYIYEEDSGWEPSGKDLFLWGKEFSLSEVPCRVIYDILAPTPKEYESLAIRFITRRCGVKFESLREDQMAQLGVFLKTHTEGKVP